MMSARSAVRPAFCALILPALLATVVACGADTPTGSVGTLTVVVNLYGNSTVAGGVPVNATATGRYHSSRLDPGSSATMEVTTGSYRVSLGPLPNHCWTEPSARTVDVVEGGSTEALFELTCVGDFSYSTFDRVFYLGADGTLKEHVLPRLGHSLAWNPDGSAFLVRELTGPKCAVSLFDRTTGGLSPVGLSALSYAWPWPVWSDTGHRLVLGRKRDCTGPPADEALMLYDKLGTMALDSIVGLQPSGMAWRPGTQELAYATGTEIRLHSWTNGTDSLFASVAGSRITWSADGSRLAMEGAGSVGDEIVILDGEGTELFRVGHTSYWALDPLLAQDGSGMLFVGVTPGEEGDVYYVSGDGSDERRITTSAGAENATSWAPDGEYFLYTSTSNGFTSVFLGNISGQPARELVHVSGAASARFRPGTVLDIP